MTAREITINFDSEDDNVVQDLIDALEKIVPYMVDNVDINYDKVEE